MSKLTNEQIAAGAAVIGDNGRPIGRNTAIMVADAMFPIQSPAPIPKQVAHGSGIEGLTRYQFDCNEYDEGALEPWSTGEWVKFADVERLLATQSAKQGSQEDGPTYMDDKQASDWAWAEVKREVGAGGWTCGEYGNYYGFFLWGWRYGKQFVKQGTTAGDPAPAASLQTMDDTTRDEALADAEKAVEGALAVARDEALEEAAKLIEEEVPCSCCFSDDEVALATNLAAAIRALMKSASPVSGEDGEKGGDDAA